MEEAAKKLSVAEVELERWNAASKAAKEAAASLVSDRAALLSLRPGFFARLFSTRRYKHWRTEMEALSERLRAARKQETDAQRSEEEARSSIQQCQSALLHAEADEIAA